MEMSVAKYGLGEIESVSLDAVTRAEEADARAVVLLTRGNETARWVAKYHGKAPIFLMTDNTKVFNQVEGYYRGCLAVRVEEPMALPQLVEKIRQAGHELESGVVVMVDDWDKKPVMTEASI